MSNVVAINPTTIFSGQQLALIKNTVAADCNAMEFDLFMEVARQKGLDPFAKQIHAVVYNKDKPAKRKMAIITAIDGFRVIAERSGEYRPDEDEPEYTYDPDLKGPLNPLGIVKAKVKVYKRDRPAPGVAYWEEFAPIKDEWTENDAGKWKPTGRQTLDTGGNWFKMPRLMLAKCAEAQALRKAFPERLSGLYEGAEFDRIVANDLSPSEQIAAVATEDRLLRIGGASGITMQFMPNAALENVPLGAMADRIVAAARDFTSTKHHDWFTSVNRASMQEFWARVPTDALEAKKALEARRLELFKVEQEAEGEAERQRAEA